MAIVVIHYGLTGQDVEATLYERNGSPVNLTGKTLVVHLREQKAGGYTITRTATPIGQPTDGVVKWAVNDANDFGTGKLYLGNFDLWWTVNAARYPEGEYDTLRVDP